MHATSFYNFFCDNFSMVLCRQTPLIYLRLSLGLAWVSEEWTLPDLELAGVVLLLKEKICGELIFNWIPSTPYSWSLSLISGSDHWDKICCCNASCVISCLKCNLVYMFVAIEIGHAMYVK